MTTTYTLTSGIDHINGAAGGDIFNTTIANLQWVSQINGDSLNGGVGANALDFTNSGTITSTQLIALHNIQTINLANGGPNTITLYNAALNQSGGTLTVNGGANGNTFGAALVLNPAHNLVLNGGAGNDFFNIQTGELPYVAISGGGGSDTLNLVGGGAENLAALGNVTGVGIIQLDSHAAFLTLAASGSVRTGTNSDTVVVGPNAGSATFLFGAAGQTADGGSGNDNFVPSTVEFGIAPDGGVTTINGEGGVGNLLSLTGGGTFDLSYLDITNVQRIQIDNNDSTLQSYCAAPDYAIGARDGDDNFYLNDFGAHTRLIAGNGNDTVWLGADSQIVSLGSGINNVYETPNTLDQYSVVNGGSGANNTLWLECGSESCVVMGRNVVGFHTAILDFDDYGYFKANTTAGLVVEGTEDGGDRVTLNAQTQSYLGNTGGDGDENYSNHVILNAGGLAAGVTLDGGAFSAQEGCNTLELTLGGTYNFPGATVTNFMTVDVDNTGTNLTLNALGTNTANGGYLVNVNADYATALNDHLIGGAGDDTFTLSTCGAPVVLTGVISGGGGDNVLDVSHGIWDLTGAALSGLSEINIAAGSAGILTSDQITGLNAQQGGFTLSDAQAAGLTIEVSADQGNTFNLADLHVTGFGGNIVIIDNNNGDTIYGGPQCGQTIILGTGNDWINAGSGSTTVIAANGSGNQSVLISGNGIDTFKFGTSGETMLTQDTILGPTSGYLTVEVVYGATVDFSDPNFYMQGVNKLTIDSGATAAFTIEQLAGLATNNPGIVIDPGTLKIYADINPPGTNTITLADLHGDTGDLLVDVTAFSNLSTAPVIIDASDGGLYDFANNVTIDANSGFETITLNNATDTVNVGNGVETITGGTGTDTAVFDIADFQTSDTFIGTGGTYIFEVDANTDFNSDTVSGPVASLTVQIAPDVIARAAASDLMASPGLQVTAVPADIPGYPPTGHFYVDLSNAVDISANIPLLKDTTVFDQASVAVNSTYIDETIWGSNNGDTITLDATGLQTRVFDGNGADHITFTVGLSGSLADTISGAAGQNTVELAYAGTDDFTGSSYSQISIWQIDTGAHGIFDSTKLDGSTLDGSTVNLAANATFEVYVMNESSNFFSLQNVSVGPITGSENLLLNTADPVTSTVILHADGNGDTLIAGSGTETIWDGGGGDKIQAGQNADTVNIQFGFASALAADEVIGWATAGGTLKIVFDNNLGGTQDQWAVQGALAAGFMVAPVTINGEGESASTTIKVNTNTDLTGASISNINKIDVDSGDSVVVTGTQLAAFAAASVILEADSSTSNLVIEDISASFVPTLSPDSHDLLGWSGSVTIDGTGAGNQVIDAHNLDGNTFSPGGLYIYAGTGNDTITGTVNADHLIGGAGNDTIQFRGGDAFGDTVNGGGGTNTIELTGADAGISSFAGGAITNIRNVHFDASTQANLNMTITADQLVIDQASLVLSGTGPLTLSSAAGNHNYSFEVDANSGDNQSGNVDLSGVNDAAYTAAGGSFRAVLYVNDTNTSSVTVYGSNNGLLPAAATAGTLSTDILQVGGYGDTVRPGTGATEVIFQHYNVANSFQYNTADLGNATAANGSLPLSLEGDLVRGLADGAAVIDGQSGHRGYIDITGFTLTGGSAVNTTPTHGIDLAGPNGFAHFGVVEDNDIITQTFITGGTTGGLSTPNTEQIFAAGVNLAAGELAGALHQFTDSATNRGFVTVWDNNSDVALFYVNHNNTLHPGLIASSEIKLVGVFDTVDGVTLHDGAANLIGTGVSVPVLSQLFFHIH